MEHVHRLILEYHGWFYPITVGFTFLQWESFVPFAGAASARGLLNPWLLTLCAWSGSFLSDQTTFFIGRRFGPMILQRRPGWKKAIDRTHHWIQRWDAAFIILFRFMPGVRNIAALALGLSDLAWARFTLLNFIGAGFWASVFVSVGYFFGRGVSIVLEHVELSLQNLIIGAVLVLAVALLIRFWLRRRAPIKPVATDSRPVP